jgi:hypothetical protein
MKAGGSSRRRIATAAALILFFGAACLGAEAADAAQGPSGSQSPSGAQGSADEKAKAAADEDSLPEPDQVKEENPFSRFEIVSLGSYPIMLFYVGFAFDLQRYFASGNDPNYAPWPFTTSYSTPLSNSERLTRLGVTLGVSCAIGAIDAIIHASKVKAAKRLREARMSIDSGSEGQ